MTEPDTWHDRSPHASEVISANGIRLHYLDWGGHGDPLVLIHGLGDSPHVFDDLAPELVHDFRVVAYARRAHGESEAAGPFDVDTLTEDLRQFLDRLMFRRVHLAGWSLAGRELTRFTELYPDRVRSLVYLDAAYDRTDPAWRQAFADCPVKLFPADDALRSLEAYRQWQRTTWFADSDWPDGAEANMRATTLQRADGTLESIPSDETIAEIVSANSHPDAYRREYRKIVVPALFVVAASWLPEKLPDDAQRRAATAWTRQDYLPVRQSTLARIRADLPTAEIVELPSGSHMDFVFSHRDTIIACVRHFVRRRCAS